MNGLLKLFFPAVLMLFCSLKGFSQFGDDIKWNKEGNSYTTEKGGGIVEIALPSNTEKVILPKDKLTDPGAESPIKISDYAFSADKQKVLLFTNTKKVWRYNTRGDYGIADLPKNIVRQ